MDSDPKGITADFNHPLAGKPLGVTAVVHDVRPKFEEHGGSCIDWAETLVAGPGIQARINGRPTDFFSGHPFTRENEAADADFYGQPRMVHHMDSACRAALTELYQSLLSPGMAVLDLMGSWASHLPSDLNLASVTGLGMNSKELAANERLGESVVHDLNADPGIPLEGGRFDAVLCNASVEYLVQPFRVFDEVARVLKPGGLFVVSFSDRWFAPKAIGIWNRIHAFERLGLVLEYFRKGGRFADLETFSLKGMPRPEDDKYYPEKIEADPLFAVWGRVGG